MKLAAVGLILLACLGVGATLLLADDTGSALSPEQAEAFGKRIAGRCGATPRDVALVRCERGGTLWRCQTPGVNEGTVTFPDDEHSEVSVIC